VRERGGERWRWWAAWAESGEAGGVWMGRRREKGKGKKKKREVGWAAGREMGWVFFQSFSNLFQTFFFKFKSSTSFQIQILTQISPTI
jgi:hypothetical protein